MAWLSSFLPLVGGDSGENLLVMDVTIIIITMTINDNGWLIMDNSG